MGGFSSAFTIYERDFLHTAHTILFPFKMDGKHLGVRLNPPKLGEHTHTLLSELGYSDAAIAALIASK